MSLSTPDDVESPSEPDTVESPTDASKSSENGERQPRERNETVELFGGEMDVQSALSVLTDVVENPEGYGIADADRVEELEAENERLREDLEEIADALERTWDLLAVADSLSDVHMPENGP